MVDTLALGASAARHGGSSPLPPTKSEAMQCAGAHPFVYANGSKDLKGC